MFRNIDFKVYNTIDTIYIGKAIDQNKKLFEISILQTNLE